MPIINGVINKVSRDSPIVINGGKASAINGVRPYAYDKTRLVWNGYHLSPPEPGSVLYLPGYPGFGSTTFDFSYTFSDSGINTNEVLDATEPGVDCSADATTACPIGSIILIESEYMTVTATGTTLTVLRGANGSVATTHATAKDIFVWIPNNGAITGATWVQLPSGLRVMSFDGTDDTINCGSAPSLNIGTGDFSIGYWGKTSTANGAPLDKWDGVKGVYIYDVGAGTTRLALGDTASSTNFSFALPIADGNMNLIVFTCDRDSATGLLSYKNGVVGATVNNPTAIQLSLNTATDFHIGGETGVAWWKGQIGEVFQINRVLTAAEVMQHYQATKWRYQ